MALQDPVVRSGSGVAYSLDSVASEPANGLLNQQGVGCDGVQRLLLITPRKCLSGWKFVLRCLRWVVVPGFDLVVAEFRWDPGTRSC